MKKYYRNKLLLIFFAALLSYFVVIFTFCVFLEYQDKKFLRKQNLLLNGYNESLEKISNNCIEYNEKFYCKEKINE